MFSKKKVICDNFTNVSDGMKKMYREKLLPVETAYKFHELNSPRLEDPDFDAKPMVILIGQYSTGKTTFIRYLLGRDYPGIRIGPEPTTDQFVTIMYGEHERVIPGNALVVDSKKQFRSFSQFGNNFLNKFSCAEMNCELLKGVTIVDTPGILSGEKQSIERGYDFMGVINSLADRADRILLLFDAHKLDISDELKGAIEITRQYESKIRIILNKSDTVTDQQLMRVMGSLMWSLGRIIPSPECKRVFVGSFWDHAYQNDTYRPLFEKEENDLLEDLSILPSNGAVRKLNDLIQRTRSVKIHAYIVSELQSSMSFFNKEKKKAELLEKLPEIFQKLHITLHLGIGDFPDPAAFRKKLQYADFSKLPSLKPKMLEPLEQMLNVDLSRLMDLIPKEQAICESKMTLKGGVFDEYENTNSKNEIKNPFDMASFDPIMGTASHDGWIVETVRSKYDKIFHSLNLVNNKVRGDVARPELLKTKLSNMLLARIWKLSDIDKDGHLDKDEWALCMYLCDMKLAGNDIPQLLPTHYIPPSKRHLIPSE